MTYPCRDWTSSSILPSFGTLTVGEELVTPIAFRAVRAWPKKYAGKKAPRLWDLGSPNVPTKVA